MRHLYSALLYLLTPVIVLRLVYRGFRARDYWRRWPQRLGFLPARPTQPSIWLHAVSVGEFQAALPLLRALQRTYPDVPLVVTTTTPTGLQRALATFGSTSVICAHIPYDLPDAVARFLSRAQPRVAIIMETELWPNLYRGCAQRNIPVLVVNARLSEKSARGYRGIGGLVRRTLNDVTCIAAQTDEDAERFKALGANPSHVRVLGNVKYDMDVPDDLSVHAAALRAQWGKSRPVWIAGSTHAGEEAIVLDAFDRTRAVLPDTLLILVPRHPERFAEVAELCVRRGLRVCRRSDANADRHACQVYVGDTMGDLLLLYAASDAAFVGGSLVAVGGHNMLEPAAVAVPVAMGPHTFNFRDVAGRMLAAGAAHEVRTADDLARVMVQWLQATEARLLVGQHGQQVVAANRGAVQRVLALIAESMS